jgi:hypothetical protein
MAESWPAERAKNPGKQPPRQACGENDRTESRSGEFRGHDGETRHFEILLAEDNPEEAKLARLALEEYGVKCTLRVTRDGAQTIEFLGASTATPKARRLIFSSWT